ncbi:MAG: M50 family metallopeptidase [Eubacteriaceae bacterium]|nr:M50 family metallopeptidase [Eubacteriaceae bacterium]
MGIILSIIVSILIFGLLIIGHELGHFLAARASGVEVIEFAIGMGPVLYSKQGPVTKYTVRALPIGGYCLMKGDDEEDGEAEPGSINFISPLKRIFVMASGALANFVAAFLIFFLAFCLTGTDATTTIESVEAGSAAQAAGMGAGMKITNVNGEIIKDWADFSKAVSESGGNELRIVTKSADSHETFFFIVTPRLDENTGAYRIGVVSKPGFNFFHAVARSFIAIGQYIAAISFVFKGVLTGQFAFSEAFAGPIGATAEIGRQLSNGLLPVIAIAGAISVSLGFFNLLPLPSLDGSRIAFALVELAIGKPVSRKWEGRIHYAGLILLLAFAAVVAYSDIAKLL